MSPISSAAVAVAAVLLVADPLILAHELGHYAAARALGVTARPSAVGIGPMLLRRVDRRGTEWTFALLPAGGFVSFAGGDARRNCGYAAKPPLIRVAIVAAGPATNLLLAFLVFAGLLSLRGVPVFLPVVTAVVGHSAAEAAGFQVGDGIIAVDGRPVATFDVLRPTLQADAGKSLTLQVRLASSVRDLVRWVVMGGAKTRPPSADTRASLPCARSGAGS